MYILKALYDQEKEINLCFASKEGAQRFKDFVNIYMDDSGAGNGYGAYWVYEDEKIKWRPFEWMLPKNTFIFLDGLVLVYMLRGVLVARMAESNPNHNIRILAGCARNRGLVFSLSEDIPKRQTPKVGDMYRVPRSKYHLVANSAHHEGRILNEDTERFQVVGAHEERQDGSIKSNADIGWIPKNSAMKINDWLYEINKHIRGEKES